MPAARLQGVCLVESEKESETFIHRSPMMTSSLHLLVLRCAKTRLRFGLVGSLVGGLGNNNIWKRVMGGRKAMIYFQKMKRDLNSFGN